MSRILFVDIETSPLTGLAWESFETNILKVIEPVKVICCSWKWLGDEETVCRALPDYDGYESGKLDDRKLIEDIWKVLDSADIVCGHNSDSFDIKRLNARFLYYGLSAPSPYKTIDTLKIAKRYFKFESNSLDNLGAYLEEGRKEHTGGLGLWLGCMSGDSKSWEQMKTYNIQDVLLLERIYLRLRPFVSNHPDTSEDTNSEPLHCFTCSSTDVEKRGFSLTASGKKQRIQCKKCGSWSLGPLKRVYKSE